ncbi:RNA-dependent RNA polymerase 6 [Tanacetum coccineum]
MDRYPNACLEELEAFMTLWDVKPRVEESSLETLSVDELITQLRQMCEYAEDRASNAQKKARQKRKEALEEMDPYLYSCCGNGIVVLKASNSDDHNGRLYYCCPLAKGEKNCGFRQFIGTAVLKARSSPVPARSSPVPKIAEASCSSPGSSRGLEANCSNCKHLMLKISLLQAKLDLARGLEVGLLGNRDTFFVGWRGADSGVDFLIDLFDRSCKFLSRKIPLFLSKEQGIMQTADDDIHTTHPSEMLDDDDPWIRTTDFTPSGAIGRCNTYRVLIRARDEPKAKTALAFLEGQPKVNIEHPVTELKCSGTVVKPMRDGGADHRPE